MNEILPLYVDEAEPSLPPSSYTLNERTPTGIVISILFSMEVSALGSFMLTNKPSSAVFAVVYTAVMTTLESGMVNSAVVDGEYHLPPFTVTFSPLAAVMITSSTR